MFYEREDSKWKGEKINYLGTYFISPSETAFIRSPRKVCFIRVLQSLLRCGFDYMRENKHEHICFSSEREGFSYTRSAKHIVVLDSEGF
jgi:hypothetical protein